MHIAIDARMYGTAQRGIGRYLIKLIEALEVVDKENHYTIFLRKENFEEYHPKNPNFKKALWDVPWYGWREQVSGVRLQVSGIDLVHFPHWNVPLFFNRPFIVTVHDLELFSSNRTHNSSTRGRLAYWLKFQAFKLIFRHAVLGARAIIVPSNAVRKQLLALYPQVSKKVSIIYEAATITPPSHSEQSEESHTLPKARDEIATLPSVARNDRLGKYILYVGAAYPHKNLPRLLESWQTVHKELPNYKLILVGREDFFWKKLQRDIARMGFPVKMLRSPSGHGTEGERGRAQAAVSTLGEPTAVFTETTDSELSSAILYGPATDDELSALYKNAALLVQPSLEEGFSLSPLEALAHNTPVAISDIPVHREILGNAAAYFDPRDPASIAKTLITALHTPVTSTLPRAYSWNENAKQTLHLYDMALLV